MARDHSPFISGIYGAKAGTCEIATVKGRIDLQAAGKVHRYIGRTIERLQNHLCHVVFGEVNML